MCSLYPVCIFLTSLLNIHNNIFICLAYCPSPPLNRDLHKVKDRVYICSSLNLLHLALRPCRTYIFLVGCLPGKNRSPTNAASCWDVFITSAHPHPCRRREREATAELSVISGAAMPSISWLLEVCWVCIGRCKDSYSSSVHKQGNENVCGTLQTHSIFRF